MRIDPVTGDVSIGTPTEQEQEPVAFDALVAISLLTHLGGEVADYEDVVEAVRRLHALNGELGAALRRLISYCNTLENRLMEADGEHPAVQEAKEAWAKVEGKA
jgi:NTP pyrophosphatase (non-canonical NTP hydrolase)